MAKKKSGFTRRTISIPSDLNSKMMKYEDVNWSSVAKMAFEAKLVSLSKPKVSKEMRQAVERLRALQAEEQGSMYDDGFAAGTHWAGVATPRELKRLEALWANNVTNWDYLFDTTEGSASSGAYSLYATISGDDRPDRDEVTEFYERWNASAEEIDDGDFIRGFADGALEVWRQV